MAAGNSSQKRKRTSVSDNDDNGPAVSSKKEKLATNPSNNATKSSITTRASSSKMASVNATATCDSDCEGEAQPARNSRVSTVANTGSLTQATLAQMLLPVVWEDKRLAVRRHREYNTFIEAVKNSNSMRQLKTRSFYLEGVLPDFGGRSEHQWEITEDVWPEVVSILTSVTVVPSAVVDEGTNPVGNGPGLRTPPVESTTVGKPPAEPIRTLQFCGLDGVIKTARYRQSATFGSLRRALEGLLPPLAHGYTFIADGYRVKDHDRMVEFEDEIVFYAQPVQVGGKPVIYILSPTALEDVQVSLALVPQWSFSAVYPCSTIHRDEEGEKIQWIIDAAPDGTLLDKSSGSKVSYLFWEAETNSAPPLTPASSRPASPQHDEQEQLHKFDPSCSGVNPNDAVLLPIDKVPAYLDRALSALTLHTEARTSFITYWLPSLLKHKYVALQFLPQKVYEVAAPMNVTPVPEVITRVFMLFQGVEDKDLTQWSQARLRTEEDVSRWARIVGVDVEKAMDTKLYRVLEWGGMEVRAR
ncbi:hypothetical protein BC629DRAFT_1542928 [Irpex lacteus]|nr:hypothetical protein BC629DRAFT_1542928 [Irpex lacteus]